MPEKEIDLKDIDLKSLKINDLVQVIRKCGFKGLSSIDTLLRNAIANHDEETVIKIRQAIFLEKLRNVNFFKNEVIKGTYKSYLDSMSQYDKDCLVRDFIYFITRMDEGEMYDYDYYYALLVAYMNESKKLTMQTKREG